MKSRFLAPATPLGKVKNDCRRIFTTSPVLIFGLRTPQVLTPWIIMYGALLTKTPIVVPVLEIHSLSAELRQFFRPFAGKVLYQLAQGYGAGLRL